MSSKDTKKSTNGNDERTREMNAELLVSSVHQHELTERAEAAEARLLLSEGRLTQANTDLKGIQLDLKRANFKLEESNRGLERANVSLEDSYAALERANVELEDKRRAALNLMEDAVEARQTAERSEKAQRVSESKFRTLFESIDEGFSLIELIFDDNGKVVDYWLREANPMYAQLTGLHDSVGKRGKEVLPYIEPEWLETFETVHRTGEPVRFEYPLKQLGRIFAAHISRVGDEGSRLIATVFDDITERRRAEETRAHLASIVESSDDAIISKDLQGVIRSWNKGAEKIFGYTAEEIVGQPITLLIPPEHIQEEPLILERIGRGETIAHFDTVRRRKDGTDIDISLTISPIRDESGRIIAASKVARDITERKHVEEALRESEARFRYTSDSAPVHIWMSDAASGRVWFNKPWLKFTGRSMDEELGDGWIEAIHPDDRERHANVYQTALRAKREFTMEYRLRRHDGEYRWLLEHSVPRFDSDGVFLGYIGSCSDIHDRREAESALRRSEARLQLAMRVGNFGTWDLNYVEDRMILSEKLFEIFGLQVTPDRTMTVEQFDGLVHPDDAVRVAKQIVEARELRQVFSEEYRILRPDRAEPIWIQAVAQFFYDPDGKPVRSVGIVQDITESKAIAERIRASEAQLRLITDSIPALVSYIDRNERYRFVNRQYTEWFGKSNEDIIGRSMVDFLGREAYESLRPRISEALAGNRITFDTWLNYQDAGPKYVHVSYVPHVNPNGEVAGYYALVSDLTEQKRAEDRLRSSERRMQMLTESFTDYAIISTDNEGRIDSWNPGAVNIFGYSEEEIVGSSADVLFIPEDVAKGVPRQEMSNARRTGRAIDERWHIKKDGTRFFASGVMAPLYVGEKLTGYAKIASDLTERKRNAEELQRAYDEMELRVLDRTRELADANESLVSEVNERKTVERQRILLLQRIVNTQEDERRRIARDLHDHLGQRLTALRLKLASLRDACRADEELFARATHLQQIAELVDSEVGFLAWELRPSALDEFGLDEAIDTFVKEWSRHYEKQAEFHSTGLKDLRLNSETETQLYRITQEALNNIIKHADAQTVSVLLKRTGDNVVLIIEDDGKGFDAERLLSSSKKGRGLGLFGMRERAELIGGTMDIESEPGRGTTVYVRIMVTDFTQKHANEG